MLLVPESLSAMATGEYAGEIPSSPAAESNPHKRLTAQ